MPCVKVIFIELEEKDDILLPVLREKSKEYAICGMVMMPDVGKGEVDALTAQEYVLKKFQGIRPYLTTLYAFFSSPEATIYPWNIGDVTTPPKYGALAVFASDLKNNFGQIVDFHSSIVVSDTTEFEEMAIEAGVPFMTREEWLNA